MVTKANSDGVEVLLAKVQGIPNDGGDPGQSCGENGGIDCDAAIIWPSKHFLACTAEVQP